MPTTSPVRPAAMLRIHTPTMMTKDLAVITKADGKRKLVLSSNGLRLFGFEPGVRILPVAMPGQQGLSVTFDTAGPQQVYEREYKSRRSNPLEAVLDIGSQGLLDAALPGYTRRVHVTMRHGEVVFAPATERAFAIRRALKQSDTPLRAFVALSAGVDAACMTEAGLRPEALLEWRPQEKRDARDLTETGVMTAMANTPFRWIFNHDLRLVDHARVRAALGDTAFGVLHISIQCDDFSNLKSASLKAKAVEDLETTKDLTYDALRLIETVAPATVVVEQVPNYATSPACELLTLKLRRWGYYVSTSISDARDFAGRSGRKRFYLVASLYPHFAFPAPTTPERAGSDIWGDIIAPGLAGCRDITETYGVRKGHRTGRSRAITPESRFAPTVVKSQSRGCADSITLESPDGRIYAPTEQMLQQMNDIPATFTLAATSQELGIEQIGQSIAHGMHLALMVAVRDHLLCAWQGVAPVAAALLAEPEPEPEPAPARCAPTAQQLGLPWAEGDASPTPGR